MKIIKIKLYQYEIRFHFINLVISVFNQNNNNFSNKTNNIFKKLTIILYIFQYF